MGKKRSVIFPKPGELVKTSNELCVACKYVIKYNGTSTILCDYYLSTGINRGCKCGTCNKFEKAVVKKRKKLPN